MKLYGVWFSGRYDAFDSYHKCVSKKLFKTEQEAIDYIPIYCEEVKRKSETLHKGFYRLDDDIEPSLKVIDFEFDD